MKKLRGILVILILFAIMLFIVWFIGNEITGYSVLVQNPDFDLNFEDPTPDNGDTLANIRINVSSDITGNYYSFLNFGNDVVSSKECVNADITGDGFVDLNDFVRFKNSFGCEADNPFDCGPSDIDNDMDVDLDDFGFLKENFWCDVKSSKQCFNADADEDEDVDLDDFIILKNNFGESDC